MKITKCNNLIYIGKEKRPLVGLIGSYLKPYKKDLKWILLLNLIMMLDYPKITIGWIYLCKNHMKKICP